MAAAGLVLGLIGCSAESVTGRINGFGSDGGVLDALPPGADALPGADVPPAADVLIVDGRVIDVGFADATAGMDAGPAPDLGPPPDAGPPPDLNCPITGAASAVDWGPVPANSRTVACVEIRNDQPTARAGEVAFSSVPIGRANDLRNIERLALVGPGGRMLPVQFEVVSRWGGLMDDVSLPIRWLEVSTPASVAAASLHELAIVELSSPAAPNDPMPITIANQGNTYTVETGAATFVLDATQAGLFQRMTVGQVLYDRQPNDGFGPRMVLDGGAIIDTTSQSGGTVQLDNGGFEVLQRGPVKVVVVQRGHFVGNGGSTNCAPDMGVSYEPFGYTMVATFTRGQPYVDLQFNFRNECTENFGGPWTNNSTTVEMVSFELPLSFGGAVSHYYAGGAAVAATNDDVTVEQRRGAGNPWARRARVMVGGNEVVTGQAFDTPYVGMGAGGLVVSAQMPWMRFREPQALAATGSTLSLRFVSERLIVGEARGIWGMARVDFTQGVTGPGDLEVVRGQTRAGLERGLLVRASRDTFNSAGLFPSLGEDRDSPVRRRYLETLELLHTDTINDQWRNSKTYGSQLWPDTPFNPAAVPDPSTNGVEMNYWNGSRTELFEYMRTGNVKWAWDWALPISWYEFFSAYSNAGEHQHGNRNGFAVTSGGCGWANDCCHEPPPAPPGCDVAGVEDHGHWNRTGQGSDDYSYTHGDVAYVVRPNFPLQRRFAQAGDTVVRRYVDDPRQRGLFVSQRDVYRQVIQHFVILANCAEFVPAAKGGRQCHDKLIGILAEMAEDNFKPGVICARDDVNSAFMDGTTLPAPANPRTCIEPQRFMLNALMVPFFHRILANYGDIGGTLRRALIGSAWNYYVNGMGLPLASRPTSVSDPSRPAIITGEDGAWSNLVQYTLTPDRTGIESCRAAPIDQIVVYDELSTQPVDCVIHPDTRNVPPGAEEDITLYPNRPHTVAWLLVAHNLDPSLRVCGIGKAAFDDQQFLSYWDEYLDGTPHGWIKGPAQMMQGVVFGMGAYDTCSD